MGRILRLSLFAWLISCLIIPPTLLAQGPSRSCSEIIELAAEPARLTAQADRILARMNAQRDAGRRVSITRAELAILQATGRGPKNLRATGRVIRHDISCISCGNTFTVADAKSTSTNRRQCPGCAQNQTADPAHQSFLPEDLPVNSKGKIIGSARDLSPEHQLVDAKPDWSCGYCGNLNSGERNTCRTCPGERDYQPISVGTIAARPVELEPFRPSPRFTATSRAMQNFADTARKVIVTGVIGIGAIGALAGFVWLVSHGYIKPGNYSGSSSSSSGSWFNDDDDDDDSGSSIFDFDSGSSSSSSDYWDSGDDSSSDSGSIYIDNDDGTSGEYDGDW